MVGLGLRIIPMLRTSILNEEKAQQYSSFTPIMVIGAGLAAAFLTVGGALVFVGLSSTYADKNHLQKIFWTMSFCYQVCLTSVTFYQYQRVKNAVAYSIIGYMAQGSVSGDQIRKIKAGGHAIRRQQMIFFVYGLGVAPIYLSVACGIPFYYYLTFVFPFFDVASSFFYIRALCFKRSLYLRNKHSLSSKRTPVLGKLLANAPTGPGGVSIPSAPSAPHSPGGGLVPANNPTLMETSS